MITPPSLERLCTSHTHVLIDFGILANKYKQETIQKIILLQEKYKTLFLPETTANQLITDFDRNDNGDIYLPTYKRSFYEMMKKQNCILDQEVIEHNIANDIKRICSENTVRIQPYDMQTLFIAFSLFFKSRASNDIAVASNNSSLRFAGNKIKDYFGVYHSKNRIIFKPMNFSKNT